MGAGTSNKKRSGWEERKHDARLFAATQDRALQMRLQRRWVTDTLETAEENARAAVQALSAAQRKHRRERACIVIAAVLASPITLYLGSLL